MTSVRANAESAYAIARKEAIREWERRYLAEQLESRDGNVSQTARDIGIDRVYLHRLLRRHKISGQGMSRRTCVDCGTSPAMPSVTVCGECDAQRERDADDAANQECCAGGCSRCLPDAE